MNNPLSQYQNQINQIARDHHINYLALFGSTARGDNNPDSDIDLLVNFDKRLSLLDLVHVENIFRQTLGHSVDLVPEDSLNKIEQFLTEINHDESTFSTNLHWQNAFTRELEIIGEAANQLYKTFLTDHPEIPWESIIGMRHKLIHDYFEIKMELVWDAATIDLPRLKPQLLSLLN
jgi:uncharacterized protein with HEPN domain